MDPSPTDVGDGGGDHGFFGRERHIRFLTMMYESLPSDYERQEVNHLTLAYFVISGLDILGAIDRVDKDDVANWVLSFQVHPQSQAAAINGQFYGFNGSRSSQYPLDRQEDSCYNGSHLASTYCALAILKTVGFNLSNINSNAIVMPMKNLQQPDGSFMPIHIGAESDLRFVYCAVAISSMLDNWDGMNKENTRKYILRCQSYDGGFGLVPGAESHGGATYCAIASLQLMGFIDASLVSESHNPSGIDLQLLLEWALQRQAADGGFQGRSNKASDTCYAFWVCGVLRILGASDFFDKVALRKFLLSCQSEYGGFKKFPYYSLPDLYHSYFGFSAFSLLEEPGLSPLCVELGITAGANISS